MNYIQYMLQAGVITPQTQFNSSYSNYIKPSNTFEIANRQAYAESRYEPEAKSPVGAYGIYQIMKPSLTDYNRANNTNLTLEDLKNTQTSGKVRNWILNNLLDADFINKEDSSDEIKMAKALASYNWGRGNVLKALTKAKKNGVDINNSYDWLSYMPKETRDYVNFILRGLDANSTHLNNNMYNNAKKSAWFLATKLGVWE